MSPGCSSAITRLIVHHLCFERVLAVKARALFFLKAVAVGGVCGDPWHGPLCGGEGRGRLFFSQALALIVSFIYIVKLKQILASSAFL